MKETKRSWKVRGRINIFPGPAAWMFVSIPKDKLPKVKTGGWGSIPVMAKIGKTSWRTSLFPIKGKDYFIPLKKSIRKKEDLLAGDLVTISYTLA